MKTKHEEKSSKKRHQCHFCNKVILGSTYKFRAHLYQHSAVNARFVCCYCSKEYYRRDVFEKHIAVHTGIRKVHICDHCDRSFVDKRNLITHLYIHDDVYGKTKFKCMACDTTYCEERLLKYHIRKQHFNLHKKEPSYVKKMLNETWVERVMETQVCVEMTKVNNNVIDIKKSDIEMKIKEQDNRDTKFKDYISSVFACKDTSHYSKAICDYCNKEMLKKSLLMHIRERHLKVRKFKCDECSASFSRHYLMVNHVCGKFKQRK